MENHKPKETLRNKKNRINKEDQPDKENRTNNQPDKENRTNNQPDKENRINNIVSELQNNNSIPSLSNKIAKNDAISISGGLPLWITKKIEESREEIEYLPNRFYVSELTSCLRQSLMFRNPTVFGIPMSLKDKYVFVRGKIIHDFFLKDFKIVELKKTFTLNQKEYEIVGHPDYIEDNILYELKTVNYLEFQKDLPFEENVFQIRAYDTLNNLKFKKLIIIYLGMSDWKTVEVKKKDVTNELLHNLTIMVKCLKEQRFPTKDEHTCYWCKHL